MSLARVQAMGFKGVEGYPVLVELELANGIPSFSTVGLPDDAVREARERVTSALRSSGFAVPNRRVTVNLSPARPRKQGSHYELPMALGLLAASGQVAVGDWNRRWCVLGELSLDGSVRPVPGVLAMALGAKAAGFEAVMVAEANVEEAGAAGLVVLPVADLREAAALVTGAAPRVLVPKNETQETVLAPDFSDVRGQYLAKRAVELAVSGGHNALMIGPPGAGKSMLARRVPGILPLMTREEAVEVTLVASACGSVAVSGLARQRPFRAPHHSCSSAAMVGGGPLARAGEACLAHGGVLFLDEVAEFSRSTLEALRQPLEDRRVRVARAKETVEYPARFMLMAAANPCPCGWRGHPRRACLCAPPAVARYLSRLSGPLLDRIDIHVEVSSVSFKDWAGEGVAGESSADVRRRVTLARERQRARWGDGGGALNAYVDAARFRREAKITPDALRALAAAEQKTALSARALDRVLRVARTVADIAGIDSVRAEHVMEAASFRGLDRLRTGLGDYS